MWDNYPAAIAKLKTSMDKVRTIYKERVASIKKILTTLL